ncbi:MAG: hypothetical protein AAF387_15780 [Pseudomonadota bacterium]
MFIGGLHGHLQPLEIVQDEEKVTIFMKPCGSGGRLVQHGGYEAPLNFHRVKTFWRDAIRGAKAGFRKALC